MTVKFRAPCSLGIGIGCVLGWVDFPFVMIESHVGMFFVVVLAWKADFFLFFCFVFKESFV